MYAIKIYDKKTNELYLGSIETKKELNQFIIAFWKSSSFYGLIRAKSNY